MVVNGKKPVLDPEDERRAILYAEQDNPEFRRIAEITGATGAVGVRAGIGAGAGGVAIGGGGQRIPPPPPLPQLHVEDTPWMRGRKYRDSAYAVLASMYVQLRPDPHLRLKTSQVETHMAPYSDNPVGYDYRRRQHGAFKAMDGLVDRMLICKHSVLGESRVLCSYYIPKFLSVTDIVCGTGCNLLTFLIIARSQLYSTPYASHIIYLRRCKLLHAHAGGAARLLPTIPRQILQHRQRRLCRCAAAW